MLQSIAQRPLLVFSRPPSFAWLVVLAVVSVASSGCSRDTSAERSAEELARGETPEVVVKMTDRLNFMPSQVQITAGHVVRWENSSYDVHTVTADPALAKDPSHASLPEGAMPFNSGDILPGKSYSRMFTIPGRYRYFCLHYEEQRMIGEVNVLLP